MTSQVVAELADGVLDTRLRRGCLLLQLLFERLCFALSSLSLFQRLSDLFSARIKLFERQIDQVFQASDSRNCLLDQVELLGL